LFVKVKFASAGSLQTGATTAPASRFLDTSSCSSLLILAISSGSVPTSVLPLTSTTVVLTRSPSSGGIQPSRRLLRRMSSSSVSAIRPTLRGMQPTNWLLASTTSDAVELPKFFGMKPTKRLLLTTMASKLFSKSSGGSSPSKLLNRRSMYLSTGIFSTTVGKPPTKRLLLTSNSWRIVRREKFSGIIPQKRLELMWNTAMSVSMPSSGGRYPAMSPPLRSTEATTLTLGSSSAVVQVTPK
jgi:hypothetical protein